MLVVKVEMWPRGSADHAYEVCRAYIANDGKASLESQGTTGSYDARFMQSIRFNQKKVWNTGRAENIHRTRRGIWDILYVCLRSAGMEARNPGKGA